MLTRAMIGDWSLYQKWVKEEIIIIINYLYSEIGHYRTKEKSKKKRISAIAENEKITSHRISYSIAVKIKERVCNC